MELIPKEEEDELISNEVNMLQNCCGDADNETLSACLFVIPPRYLDSLMDLYPNVSCVGCSSIYVTLTYFNICLAASELLHRVRKKNEPIVF